ncbi:MAG TPA: hypothetical protein VEY33_05790 [Gemmatimonadota bacterium]|nr:hypothetical protein [Gemmatimonadota bacterium]
MRRTTLSVCTCALAMFIMVGHARAQEEAEPPTRIVTATSFKVPFGADRGNVIAFLTEYFMPLYQLNPNVRNFRLLNHRWGSDAMDFLIIAEYDDLAGIEAECGQPCDDYFAQHEAPEEGEPGYEEYREIEDAFTKAYQNHHDEIYVTRMDRAVVEGQMQGTVGPVPESDD